MRDKTDVSRDSVEKGDSPFLVRFFSTLAPRLPAAALGILNDYWETSQRLREAIRRAINNG